MIPNILWGSVIQPDLKALLRPYLPKRTPHAGLRLWCKLYHFCQKNCWFHRQLLWSSSPIWTQLFPVPYLTGTGLTAGKRDKNVSPRTGWQISRCIFALFSIYRTSRLSRTVEEATELPRDFHYRTNGTTAKSRSGETQTRNFSFSPLQNLQQELGPCVKKLLWVCFR